MATKNISRAQWAQITKRVRQVDFTFDPKWKCLVDGISYDRCPEHVEEDQFEIIAEVKKRLATT